MLLVFSYSVLSNSLWPQGLQHPRLPCPSLTPRVWSNSFPLSQRCCPTMSSSAIPLSHPQSFQHQGFFQWVGSSHQVAKVLDLQLQHQSFQWMFMVDFLLGWLVSSPCCPRDSQESSVKSKSIVWSNLWKSCAVSDIYITVHNLLFSTREEQRRVYFHACVGKHLFLVCLSLYFKI